MGLGSGIRDPGSGKKPIPDPEMKMKIKIKGDETGGRGA